MRISDWSSDVCSSDLIYLLAADLRVCTAVFELNVPQNAFCFHDDVVAMAIELRSQHLKRCFGAQQHLFGQFRSEEHTSELQSLMRISYAVFCLKKKTKK